MKSAFLPKIGTTGTECSSSQRENTLPLGMKQEGIFLRIWC